MLHALRVLLVTAIIFSAFALLQDGPVPRSYNFTQGVISLGVIAVSALALALLSETAIRRRHSNVINKYFHRSHWYDAIPADPFTQSSGVIIKRRYE